MANQPEEEEEEEDDDEEEAQNDDPQIPDEFPPNYQHHDIAKKMELKKLGALGVITPNGPWSDSKLGETFARVWQDHTYSVDLNFDGPPRRCIEFHTPWFARDAAAEKVELMPYLDEFGFDTERVADAISSLPENVRVSIGRELDPVLYIWTDRVALVGGLIREASGRHVYPGRVSYFPAMWEGDEACACAEHEGEWSLVRVVWQP